MLKNKWILVLLIPGLVGIAAYNISFFASRDQGNDPSSTPTALNVPTPPQPPVQNTNTIDGTVQPQGNGLGEPQSSPPISLEEIERQAKNPVDLSVQKPLPERRPWPERDPFRVSRQQAQVLARHIEPAEPPVQPSNGVAATSLDPIFKVSAILIDDGRRFALVNGFPKAIGATVGSWRIVAIQPDYVVVQTPGGERKVEISKGVAYARQIPDK